MRVMLFHTRLHGHPDKPRGPRGNTILCVTSALAESLQPSWTSLDCWNLQVEACIVAAGWKPSRTELSPSRRCNSLRLHNQCRHLRLRLPTLGLCTCVFILRLRCIRLPGLRLTFALAASSFSCVMVFLFLPTRSQLNTLAFNFGPIYFNPSRSSANVARQPMRLNQSIITSQFSNSS